MTEIQSGSKWETPTIALSLLALGTVFVYTTFYWWGMATFENEAVSLLHSLRVVLEALTTAGFAGDAPYESTVMNAFQVVMNTTGVLFVVTGLLLFVIVLIRRRRSTQSV